MTETLRPSTLGEILDRSVQLYRRSFWLFAGTAAMPLVLLFVVLAIVVPAGIFATPGLAAGGDLGTLIRGVGSIFAFLFVLPFYLAVYVFAIAGITQAAVSANRGEKLTIRAALKSVQPRFWTYLWFLVLQGIMVGIVPLVVAGVVIGPLIYLISRSGTGVVAAAGLGFVVFAAGAAVIVVIVWLALCYSMGMAVSVVEKKTAWQSLMRAMSLSHGTRGRIFLLFLLVTVLSSAVSMFGYILAIFVGGVAAFVGRGAGAAVVAAVVGGVLYAVISIGGQIVLQPVSWIALVLFYFDQRIRKEGFDIEWMMEQAGMTPVLAPAPQGAGTIPAAGAAPDTVEER